MLRSADRLDPESAQELLVDLEIWPESQHSQDRRFLGVEFRWYCYHNAVYRLKICRIGL